ncbi:dihydroorotase [Zobellia uliginosa]|uniref:dihydroorotase n=1 Tax=Zobellia uliginosa TaxID=143224 RepID=UPI001C0798AB|nr:dihydroorotase [Zobellia uliginosa]MBU2946734.1 dihydroorotase [Zobellia uliginosa]
MNILLKSATIIDKQNESLHLKTRDIHIKNGVITKIAAKIEPESKTQVIKHKNLHVSIGWFDSSVSFGEPGYEERETIENGLRTAALSGFTDIILNPNTHPCPDSSSDIVYLKSAAAKQLTNLYPLGTLTMKADGNDLAELFDMRNAGAVGFYDYKHPVTNANLLKVALQYVQNFNGLVYSFPLDTKIAGKGIVNEGEVSTKLGLKGIPTLAEELQVVRDLFILEYTGGKLHIPTISTANSVKLISDAKKKGLNVSCSVAIHNLIYTDSILEEFDATYKVMPPLRTKSDAKALIKGLKDGTIDFVTSDHTPMNIEEKRVEFDNASYGTTGLETAFGGLGQLLDIETTISLLTKGREQYGITTPIFKEGEPACITLFNPEDTNTFTKERIESTSKNSMFIGAELQGKVYGSINNGQYLTNN